MLYCFSFLDSVRTNDKYTCFCFLQSDITLNFSYNQYYLTASYFVLWFCLILFAGVSTQVRFLHLVATTWFCIAVIAPNKSAYRRHSSVYGSTYAANYRLVIKEMHLITLNSDVSQMLCRVQIDSSLFFGRSKLIWIDYL